MCYFDGQPNERQETYAQHHRLALLPHDAADVDPVELPAVVPVGRINDHLATRLVMPTVLP